MNDCKRIAELEQRMSAIEVDMKAMKEKYEEVLTQSAAARYLLISRNTLVKHTAMGLVNNVPGTTKYRISELDRYRAIRVRK